MKIAVATIEKNENSEMSSRAGRSPYFLIFDEKGEFLEVVSNPFTVGGGGAGIAVAKMLADKNVDTVIAGAIGPNMVDALNERGIKYYERQGIAKEVLKEITDVKQIKLEEFEKLVEQGIKVIPEKFLKRPILK